MGEKKYFPTLEPGLFPGFLKSPEKLIRVESRFICVVGTRARVFWRKKLCAMLSVRLLATILHYYVSAKISSRLRGHSRVTSKSIAKYNLSLLQRAALAGTVYAFPWALSSRETPKGDEERRNGCWSSCPWVRGAMDHEEREKKRRKKSLQPLEPRRLDRTEIIGFRRVTFSSTFPRYYNLLFPFLNTATEFI